MYTEFDVIKYFFNKKNKKNIRYTANIGIGDDGAVLTIPKKQQLVVTTDSLVENTHFFSNIKPEYLAHKSLCVNLSDLAAMGAHPTWISLAITLPKINHIWLKKFSNTLFKLLNFYKIQLIGGDTTKGPMSLTYTAYGFVPYGKALTRSGAMHNDKIYITGPLGDSAVGLLLLDKKIYIKNKHDYNFFIKKHLKPDPKILHGIIIRSIASSNIDISDGLYSDLSHILNKSNCGAEIQLDLIPLSKSIKKQISKKNIFELAVSGGEDYELCFTVPKKKQKKLEILLKKNNLKAFCIGKINKNFRTIKFFYKKKQLLLNINKFEHFNQ
ncbi:MAG: thiamine-phosphate kinase [Arsenophonus sp.]|nr:MAG: thiamine-phosphate kinase [Arsenophonus sp.]